MLLVEKALFKGRAEGRCQRPPGGWEVGKDAQARGRPLGSLVPSHLVTGTVQGTCLACLDGSVLFQVEECEDGAKETE